MLVTVISKTFLKGLGHGSNLFTMKLNRQENVPLILMY